MRTAAPDSLRGGERDSRGQAGADPIRTRLRSGRPQEPDASEFKLLLLLAEQPERVFSRREIMQHLWDSSYVGDQRACDIHVSNLRQKIEPDPANPQHLLTVRGIGYKLATV